MKKRKVSELTPNNDKRDYIHSITLDCALHSCIPCMYKIFPLGHELLPPNVRPELCPRSRTESFGEGVYLPHHRILTLGDGDFSFSLSLCRGMNLRDKLIATSYENNETITSIYPSAEGHIRSLIAERSIVLHNIDARILHQVESLKGYHYSFDVVVWNFPCLRAENGADAQAVDIENNRMMLRDFFNSVKVLLQPPVTSSPFPGSMASSPPSEVHITHKTQEPFCWWNITELARDCGFHYEGSIVFDRYLYPGYINRKALDKKSFPSHDALVIYIYKSFINKNYFSY
jgi:25S rRNA (uracil2634-N3)-methyltransferase